MRGARDKGILPDPLGVGHPVSGRAAADSLRVGFR